MTPIQLIVHDELPVGFHPEYATEEHPAGRPLIAESLAWAGVTG